MANSWLKKLSLISPAPLSRLVISMPNKAAGRRPTGVKTEKRPPTFSGMSKVGIPCSVAIWRRRPFLGSVINTKFSLGASLRKYKYWLMVSGVLPDLVMTMNRVLAGSITS